MPRPQSLTGSPGIDESLIDLKTITALLQIYHTSKSSTTINMSPGHTDDQEFPQIRLQIPRPNP
jgi:hypothetical protein